MDDLELAVAEALELGVLPGEVQGKNLAAVQQAIRKRQIELGIEADEEAPPRP